MKMSVLFLVALLTYGCGAKKLAVENADTLITHQMNKKLPLYSAQKEQLAKDVDALLEKEKPTAQEILPIIDSIDVKNSPDKLESQYASLEKYYRKVAADFSALVSSYLAKLDKKQQKDLFETLDDENREILKKEKEDRIDGAEEKFQMFLGSINSKQKQILREYGDYFQQRARERLDRRVKLHENFRKLYAEDISEESRQTQFKELFQKYQDDAIAGNKNLEIMRKIIPTLSSEQKEHFRKEAQEVKDLLKYFISIDY